MKDRYSRNVGSITEEEQQILSQKAVCVIGCGGLGGGVIENLVRMGVGKLTVVDSDVFDVTNLNRQVLSNEQNIGRSKAIEAAEQMKLINSTVEITPMQTKITEENCRQIIAEHDLVIDAVDNIGTRLTLEKACEHENIVLVHGAIAGWGGQVGIVNPGNKLISKIYQGYTEDGDSSDKGAEKETGNLPVPAATVSAIQAAEATKVLLDKDEVLYDKLLVLDLLNHEYEIIEFRTEI